MTLVEQRLLFFLGMVVLLVGGALASGWRLPLGHASTSGWDPAGTRIGSEQRALSQGAPFLPGFTNATGLFGSNTAAFCQLPSGATVWACRIVSPSGQEAVLHVTEAGSVGP